MTATEAAMPVLQLRQISKRFGAVQALSNVDFEVYSNEVVALVGDNGAGKSTLISVLSAARPKIADYPFTTLVPNLGIVRYEDYKSFVMADIPGIIEGAAEGRGLGIQFLRHIERTKTLLIMVPSNTEDIAAEYATLLKELEKFDPSLLSKPRLVVITKMDIAPEDFTMPELEKGVKVLAISSVAGQGLKALKDELWRQVSLQNQSPSEHAGS